MLQTLEKLNPRLLEIDRLDRDSGVIAAVFAADAIAIARVYA
jgi:hypothetical protein